MAWQDKDKVHNLLSTAVLRQLPRLLSATLPIDVKAWQDIFQGLPVLQVLAG